MTAGADMVGFVFFEKSPRHLSHAQAAALSQIGPAHVKRVGLLVDPSDADVQAVLAAVPQLDILQVHNVAVPGRIEALRHMSQKPIYAAAGIATKADLIAAEPLQAVAGGMFYDAKAPKASDLPGGRGVAFDWTIMKSFTSPKPWLLAGGLSPENVAEAITLTGTLGVDVSSGVESAPGVKDLEKIAAFVAAARSAF